MKSSILLLIIGSLLGIETDLLQDQVITQEQCRQKTHQHIVESSIGSQTPTKNFNGLSTKQQLAGDKIRGVNLGGWLVIEPWITPSLFEIGNEERKIKDEYTFGQYLEPNLAKATLKEHWDTFVTLKDFQDLQEAGITHVRLPIGYWAFERQEGDPYIDGQLPYIKKAMEWASLTSMKLMIDIHGAPGSQNGFDNSGRLGNVTFLKATNFQSHFDIMHRVYKKIGDIVNESLFGSVVDSLELVNEPHGWVMNLNDIHRFYNETVPIIPSLFTKHNVKSVIHIAFRSVHEFDDITIPNKATNMLDMGLSE